MASISAEMTTVLLGPAERGTHTEPEGRHEGGSAYGGFDEVQGVLSVPIPMVVHLWFSGGRAGVGRGENVLKFGETVKNDCIADVQGLVTPKEKRVHGAEDEC